MDILQEIKEYLAECKVFYLATVDGENARVRPFGVSEIYNGRLYLMTAKSKDECAAWEVLAEICDGVAVGTA